MTKRTFAAVLLFCLVVSVVCAQSAATVFGWPTSKISPTADLTAKSITLSDKVKATFAEITGNIYASGTLVVPTIKAETSAGLEIKGSGDATALTIGAGGGTAVSTADGLNVGGILKTATGTAALPAYSFGSDPNTGMYSPAADSIGISVAGAEALRVNTAGEMLIATSTDVGDYKLQVNGNACVNGALIYPSTAKIFPNASTVYGEHIARVDIASGSHVSLGTVLNTGSLRGRLTITSSATDQFSFDVQIKGTANAAVEYLDPESSGSVASGTANMVNVIAAGGGIYYLQNLKTSNGTYVIKLLGS